MAFTNQQTKEIFCKILYLGASGAGKSENLRSIFKQSAKEAHLENAEIESNATKFFDFLPLSLGAVGGYHIKLHLFSLPQRPIFRLEYVEGVLTKGVDGVVFVADSRLERIKNNLEALRDTRKLLERSGSSLDDIGVVFQYNQRDAKDAVDVGILREHLNLKRYVEQEAIATQGVGTMETLKKITQGLLHRLAPL